MTSDDVPAGLRLREQAGWNQTAEDWHRLLRWEPDGCFVGELDGTVVATATTTTYGRALAFIGMVLVDQAHQRRGIGQALLGRAMAYLDDLGVATIGLDSTPAGKPLYDRLGYRDAFGLERRVGSVPELPDAGGDVRPMLEEHLPSILALDRRAFAADRFRLLRSFFVDHPDGCYVVGQGDDLRGYLFSRPGARAHHLGPLAARDGIAAELLVRAALRPHRGGRAVIDVLVPNPRAVTLADRLGLAPVRPFVRMTRGAPPPPADLETLYTSAGPELG